jgi:hypothetical protein
MNVLGWGVDRERDMKLVYMCRYCSGIFERLR